MEHGASAAAAYRYINLDPQAGTFSGTSAEASFHCVVISLATHLISAET